jgi:phenylpropionate dioxygenase-like ring-hydroxylating dioxygenase large terminal subunit
MWEALMADDGTVLADGTRLEDLVNRVDRVLSARVHTDQEIFDLEQERLFARTWIPVAHTTEFSEPGDFVTRRLGSDPVIVTLGHEGEHRVMLNVCSHRGMKVCRAELGSARTHTCPFHGWVYGSDGRLRGVPFEQAIYGDRLDKGHLGLRQARVGVYAGLIFATWDEAAPELADYLGDFRWYLDAMLCRTDAGLEVSGPPQRFVVGANWKIVAEGFFGDAYHIQGIHRSFIDIGVVPNDDESVHDFKASIDGHSVLTGDYERRGITGSPAEVLAALPPTGMSADLLDQLDRHLEPEQITMLARTPPSIAAIFPATAIVMVGGGLSAGGPLGQFISLRFFVPLSTDKTEVLSFSLVERDAPEQFKADVHQTSVGSFGVAGSFEIDDVEVWAGVQSGLHGVIGRQTVGNYQAVGDPEESDPSRPGHNHRGVSTDDNQWLFYQRWLEFLEEGAW